MTETAELLADYVKNGSEPAFAELVRRYINMVHSSALRLVNGDVHRAEDVTQTVFADLARLAGKLPSDVMLGGWLHRHTCFVASNIMRSERRRQRREQVAAEMSSGQDHSEANLALLAPILDDAINRLAATDREAILLRFFEQRDFSSVGQAIGSNEEAARKRVNRAVERLHSMLGKQGVRFSAGTLGTLLAANSVSAAPIGMSAAVTAGAIAGTGVTAGAAGLLLLFMNTKVKVGLVAAVVAAAVIVPVTLQQRALNRERDTARARAEVERAQAEQVAKLEAENRRLTLEAETKRPAAQAPDREVLELLGKIGELRTEVARSKAPKPSPMSALTANPEMRKLLRDQQKVALSELYGKLATDLNLSPEQKEKFHDRLADFVMENIDLITTVLAENASDEEMQQAFANKRESLVEELRTLIGEEGVAAYNERTRNVLNDVTALQFKTMLTGDAVEKNAKSERLNTLIRDKMQEALARAGLPADYQVVPTLNFLTIASPQVAEVNLKLMDEIYSGTAAEAGSFLSEADLKKFKEFHAQALSNNRAILAMNRKLMAPQQQ